MAARLLRKMKCTSVSGFFGSLNGSVSDQVGHKSDIFSVMIVVHSETATRVLDATYAYMNYYYLVFKLSAALSATWGHFPYILFTP